MENSKSSLGLVGSNLSLGQKKDGTEDAFEWLKLKGFKEHLQKLFPRVVDLGAIEQSLHYDEVFSPHKDLPEHFESISDFNQKLEENMNEALNLYDIVMNIGGDHSCAMGSVSAALKNNKNTKVIWVDAHGDINSPQSSPSGNVHGMPVYFLLGENENSKIEERIEWLNKLDPNNLVMIGLRDLDEGEMERLNRLGVLFFSSRDVLDIGMDTVLQLSAKHLDLNNQDPIHLSFDVDALDPKWVPSTGTAVERGLSLNDGKKIIHTLHNQYNLRSVDFVELNPHLGSKKDLEKSLESFFDLTQAFSSEAHLEGVFELR